MVTTRTQKINLRAHEIITKKKSSTKTKQKKQKTTGLSGYFFLCSVLQLVCVANSWKNQSLQVLRRLDFLFFSCWSIFEWLSIISIIIEFIYNIINYSY